MTRTAARYTYHSDAATQRIRITAHAALTFDECVAIVDRQVAEGSWSYGLLYDARAVETVSDPRIGQTVADYVNSKVDVLGPRGPVAVVSRAGAVVGAGQMYAVRSAPAMDVEVFWDIDDARRWLDQRLAPAR